MMRRGCYDGNLAQEELKSSDGGVTLRDAQPFIHPNNDLVVTTDSDGSIIQQSFFADDSGIDRAEVEIASGLTNAQH